LSPGFLCENLTFYSNRVLLFFEQKLITINNPKNLKNIKQKKASGKNPGRFAGLMKS
jgi:hypothetical protein